MPKKEYFDPKTNEFPYPEDTASHYLEVKKNMGIAFDKNYPFVDFSKGMKFKRIMLYIIITLIVFPMTYIRLGLKVENRKNLRKYRYLIKNGIITCSNHVHLWDYLAIMSLAWPKLTNVLVWDKNINGEMGGLMRLVGGIPIPLDDIAGKQRQLDDAKELLNRGGWLQIYPEASMWEYYRPIRPFKVGTSYYAIKNNKPILPLAFSYRKPNWLRRVIFRQKAVFTLNVGEPMWSNPDLPFDKAKEDLTIRLHDEVAHLAHLTPEENMYEPIYNNSKRIDYYTDTYGVGYKGSH